MLHAANLLTVSIVGQQLKMTAQHQHKLGHSPIRVHSSLSTVFLFTATAVLLLGVHIAEIVEETLRTTTALCWLALQTRT